MAGWLVVLWTVQVALQAKGRSLSNLLEGNHIQGAVSEVVYPHVLSYNKGVEVIVVVPSSKVTFYLQLRPYTGLVGYNLTANSHVGNDLYHGQALSHQGAVSALSVHTVDRTVSGIIATREGHYILRPWHHLTRRNLPTDVSPHILFRREDEIFEFCGVDIQEAVPLLPTGITLPPRRRRRADSSVKVIETAIFADRHLYKIFARRSSGDTEKELIKAVLAIMNEVQLIYNYESMKTKFKIVIVKLEILKNEMDAPDTAGGDIDEYLDNFCMWQARKNSGQKHWDHALMLSGLDLYKRVRDRRNDKVLGLAWVNGMCRDHFSCTLNEGSTFEAAFVIAHELGHSLGMLHDGRGNSCDPDRYIMSEKTGPGKVTWSSCSNNYVDNFLRKSSGSCLQDGNTEGPQEMDHERDGRLPGERFPPKKQCEMALGVDYRPHTSSREPFNNICRELWCLSGVWATPAHPALDGSTCASGKQCLQGQCTAVKGHARAEDINELSTFDKVKSFVAEFLAKLRDAFKVLG